MQLRWKWPIERNRIENQILLCRKTSIVPCIRYELLSSLIESFRIYVDQFHKLKSKRGWRRCKNFWNLSWNLLSSTPLSSNKRAYESKMKAKRFWKFNIDPVLLEWNGGIGEKMKLIMFLRNSITKLKHKIPSAVISNIPRPPVSCKIISHPKNIPEPANIPCLATASTFTPLPVESTVRSRKFASPLSVIELLDPRA